MTLDELKRLNPREIGTWPVLPKVGVLTLLLILILVGGYFLDWSAQWNKLTAARAKESELRKEFLGKKAQAVNLDAYKKQLEDVQQSFGALLKQLPNKSEMEALLSDINQAGLGRGLQFELFKPNAQEVVTEFYAEQPIAVKLSGTYHDMGAFASDVSQLSRIVTIDNVALALDKEGRLTMEATARTFRYLDEEEVAAQKKAARDDKEKTKGKGAKGKGKDKVAKKGGKQ
ncbi:MAG: type 4a pilus biogenesis protein PilO [Burkholderiales bacterium]|nr:type 4a pilus biogenesis protein PilO [Burkholderiales bacterium]